MFKVAGGRACWTGCARLGPDLGRQPLAGARARRAPRQRQRRFDRPGPVKRNSFGPALQVGASYALTKNLSLNLDVKKVWIKTDVYAGGHNAGTFKIDRVLVGVGPGYGF